MNIQLPSVYYGSNPYAYHQQCQLPPDMYQELVNNSYRPVLNMNGCSNGLLYPSCYNDANSCDNMVSYSEREKQTPIRVTVTKKIRYPKNKKASKRSASMCARCNSSLQQECMNTMIPTAAMYNPYCERLHYSTYNPDVYSYRPANSYCHQPNDMYHSLHRTPSLYEQPIENPYLLDRSSYLDSSRNRSNKSSNSMHSPINYTRQPSFIKPRPPPPIPPARLTPLPPQQQQQNRLYDEFMLISKGSNYIEKESFISLLSALLSSTDRSSLEMLFKQMDYKNDKVIDFDEFSDAYNKLNMNKSNESNANQMYTVSSSQL